MVTLSEHEKSSVMLSLPLAVLPVAVKRHPQPAPLAVQVAIQLASTCLNFSDRPADSPGLLDGSSVVHAARVQIAANKLCHEHLVYSYLELFAYLTFCTPSCILEAPPTSSAPQTLVAVQNSAQASGDPGGDCAL